MTLPTSATDCYARAAKLLQARQVTAALGTVNEAERLGYDPNDCSAIRWDCWMLLGDFERAWAESDTIASRGTLDPHRFWDGTSFAGKRVILRCLHGLGDTIQFIRYAPLLRQQALSLTVETHPELVRLLRHASGIDEVVTWGGQAPAVAPRWDSQVEVNELPRVFRSTLATIPCQIPYLLVGQRPDRPPPQRRRIGLVWSSSQWNPARSVPVDELVEALKNCRADLFSLQHGPDRGRVTPASASEGDVLDTAHDMLTMDLIISSDTMTAHLAGALGIPVWVLLPFEADWRWMLQRTDTPWYPTMRLFRQPSPGDWNSALLEIRGALSGENAEVVECFIPG